MVSLRVLLMALLLMCIAQLSYADDTNVTADITRETLLENQPISGTLTITHNESAPIDETSIRIGDKPLKVEKVRTVRLSENAPLLLVIYNFTLQGQSKGMYVLPRISVKIGDKIYQSSPSTYEVKAPQSKIYKTQTSEEPGQGQFLKLEAFVEGSDKLYPGQRTTLAYRITYKGDIEITKESLPLLEPAGLHKIGDVDISDQQIPNASVQVIKQLIEAVQPGTYTFGPSEIQGYAYQESAGQRVYLNPLLTSTVQPLSVTVEPFPILDQPASFTGAIGPLTMNVKMLTASEIALGDKIVLQIDISGPGTIEGIDFPDLFCQPGFSGLFEESDIPYQSSVQGNVKTFLVNLWSLSPLVKAIPSIEFSFFNPQNAAYDTLRSLEIPLKVVPEKEKIDSVVAENEPAPSSEPSKPIPTKPIEIQGIYVLNASDLHNLWFGTWDVFFILPFGSLLLIFAIYLKQAVEASKHRVRRLSSEELLNAAEKNLSTPQVFYYLLSQTLLTHLLEKGELSTTDIPPERIPSTGRGAIVRCFLLEVEEMRFSGKPERPLKELLERAKAILSEGGNSK